MPDDAEVPDLEAMVRGTTRLLVISCDGEGTLSLEENGFPAWMLTGVAHWLGMYAEAEVASEMEEEDDGA